MLKALPDILCSPEFWQKSLRRIELERADCSLVMEISLN